MEQSMLDKCIGEAWLQYKLWQTVGKLDRQSAGKVNVHMPLRENQRENTYNIDEYVGAAEECGEEFSKDYMKSIVKYLKMNQKVP